MNQACVWAGLALCLCASRLVAAVDVLGDVGWSHARRADGAHLLLTGFQPGVLVHAAGTWFPTVGVRLGPLAVLDQAHGVAALAGEARALAGLGWQSSRVRLDALATVGGGWWYDRAAGLGTGWSTAVGSEVFATWALSEPLRGGPGASWIRRRMPENNCDEWRLAVALIYAIE